MNNLEVIWWLDKGHNIPMDIIRFILSEWISYPEIENNDKFKECIKLWFEEDEDKQEERNNMIKKYGHISDWNTKNISDMNRAFFRRMKFNEDISRWNVSNVTDMKEMFFLCNEFNCDLSQWDVSKVTNMSAMFYECYVFNCDISQWDISNTKDINLMFLNCKSFNCDISNWNVNNIISIKMPLFYGCDNLTSLDKIKEQWHQMNYSIRI